ncbi:MAG: LysM peptidoglycan-binding domain-containing protein [Bacillota bacterium]|jgi:hypothetical protein
MTQIWLSYNNNQERFMLPVLPESFEMVCAGQNTKVGVLNLGALNLIGYPDLETISFSSHFPADPRPYAQYQGVKVGFRKNRLNGQWYEWKSGFIRPFEYVRMIQNWQKKCFPIRLIVTGTTINHAMAIESFTYGQHGPTADVDYTLSLSEYRHPDWKPNGSVYEDGITGVSYKRLSFANTAMSFGSAPGVQIYTCQQGDSFAEVARKTTGDSRNAQKIMNYNGIYDPKAIFPGLELIIDV